MIIFTPIDLPKLEPDSWEVFWNIWNTHADHLTKRKMNVDTSDAAIMSSNVWRGLDIYKLIHGVPAWDAPYYDIRNDLPNMFNLIESLQSTRLRIYQIRLISSLLDVKSHTDDNLDRWAYRSYFHYTSDKSQWYFTRPGDKEGNRHYINLPDKNQWFAYNDLNCWHGTDYDPENPKILAQMYVADQPVATTIAKHNAEKYKDYTIEF
jgi:hypothetical protein